MTQRRKRDREYYAQGLPGYHNPRPGFAGSPVARSALTARLWLAGFGIVFCVVFAVLILTSVPALAWFGWVLVALAVIAVGDFGWVAYRKWRGEPG